MRLLGTVLAIAFIAPFSICTNAATYIVTKTADTNDGVCDADCSLREAVLAANTTPATDEIGFSIQGEIEVSAGEILVENGSVSIVGFSPDTTIISGANRNRVFYVRSALSLRNMSFRKGNGTGAQFNRSGGIVASYLGSVSVENCTFSENDGALGGAIYLFLSNGTIDRSRFRNNTGQDGAGIHAQGSTLIVRNSEFAGNVARGGGGALFKSSTAGSITVEDSTFTDNSATAGGAIYSTLNATIQSSIFERNKAREADGGAINVLEGDLLLSSSRVVDNTSAATGGGVSLLKGTIRDSVLRGNSANSSGGAIMSNGTLITIENSELAGNTARSAGGLWSRAANISGSSIKGNTVTDVGGGMYIIGSTTITNSTISGNRAVSDGGGINSRAVLTLRSVTIANNQAASGAGIFGGGTTARNSIFANNSTYISTQEDVSGAFTSQGYNLIKSTLNTVITGDTATNIIGIDPLLQPLTTTDGPNYHPLSPNSPAIDKGISAGLTTDQRGQVRPIDMTIVANAVGGDGSDIGAVERQASEGLGFEGDVSVRPNGDGVVLSNDVMLVRQFVLGLLTPNTATNEFQRIDCAPYAMRGDGQLNAADVTQVRRYALRLDPLTIASGPTSTAGRDEEGIE